LPVAPVITTRIGSKLPGDRRAQPTCVSALTG
jgi:hypothetical protein